ncbi:MAG: hypothetical protein SGARI_000963 [Bacillariaceae sp.]
MAKGLRLNKRNMADKSGIRSDGTSVWTKIAVFCCVGTIFASLLHGSIFSFQLGTTLQEMSKRFEESTKYDVSHTVDLEQAIPHRGDGCYHIFLDVGANIGVHGRFLYEPHLYPKTRASVPLFEQKYGGDRSNEDYCVFEVEANPAHWPTIENKSRAYAAMGWRYELIRAAAMDKNGTMNFYHDNDEAHNEWAFSLTDWGNYSKHIAVPTFRLADWIQNEILERKIPLVPPSGRNYSKPIVGMKMDIEGSENLVLPDLITSGVFCKLDFAFGEFHSRFAPYRFEGGNAA